MPKSTRMSDLLVTSCGYAVADWTGHNRFVLTMVSHGRETAGSEVDVSRTTGWFTCFYPFVVALQETRSRTLQEVSHRLSRVPDNGIGYGLLTFLNRDLKGTQADISLNNLGAFTTSAAGARQALTPVATPETQLYGPRQQRNAELELACLFVDGSLSLYVIFQPRRLEDKEVRAFLQRWAREVEQVLELI